MSKRVTFELATATQPTLYIEREWDDARWVVTVRHHGQPVWQVVAETAEGAWNATEAAITEAGRITVEQIRNRR